MATCTECRGTKTYQPLLGPPEPCRACISSFVARPVCDSRVRTESPDFVTCTIRMGDQASPRVNHIALTAAPPNPSCQLEPLNARSHIVGEYRRAIEHLDVTSPVAAPAATKPVKFSERLPDDTAPAVLYWSVRAKGWATWTRSIRTGWAAECDTWESILDSYWLPMPPPPPGA